MTNTRRAIEESLRLYPPAWGFSRRAVGDNEIGGYPLREGWLVFVIPFVVGQTVRPEALITLRPSPGIRVRLSRR